MAEPGIARGCMPAMEVCAVYPLYLQLCCCLHATGQVLVYSTYCDACISGTILSDDLMWIIIACC